MRLVAACVAIVLSTLAALAAESTETVKYAITRNGYNIGTHTMELRRNGKDVTVKQLTLIEVKIIIVVYHFEQKEEEHWVDNRLVSMDSVVDDNGTPHKLEIRLKDNMLVVTGDGKTRQVSPDDDAGNVVERGDREADERAQRARRHQHEGHRHRHGKRGCHRPRPTGEGASLSDQGPVHPGRLV